MHDLAGDLQEALLQAIDSAFYCHDHGRYLATDTSSSCVSVEAPSALRRQIAWRGLQDSRLAAILVQMDVFSVTHLQRLGPNRSRARRFEFAAQQKPRCHTSHERRADHHVGCTNPTCSTLRLTRRVRWALF